MSDRRFKSCEEVIDLLSRGGEIELKYGNTAYSLLPNFDGGVVSSVSVWVSHEFPLERINEICDFIIENKTLNEIVPNSDVVFRTDR